MGDGGWGFFEEGFDLGYKDMGLGGWIENEFDVDGEWVLCNELGFGLLDNKGWDGLMRNGG
ncbi:hypothetical protein [Bacillus subtilis]|uniref:hypothetical protein n=1 Tax=Bacillus subtilis TaxID=1423 RepID=UPI0011A99FF7|nr:hypothetical protein [Bacillus subtilis]